MGGHGFIHDKLEIKLLVLYIMARVATPINLATLTELTFCDGGVGYFDYMECVDDLLESEHLTRENGLYTITEKGRRNSAIGETSLPYSVRLKCDKNTADINVDLRREAQIRAEIEERDNGTQMLKLILDDDAGNLLTVQMLTGNKEHALRMGKRFREEPEYVYNGLLALLTEDTKKQVKEDFNTSDNEMVEKQDI